MDLMVGVQFSYSLLTHTLSHRAGHLARKKMLFWSIRATSQDCCGDQWHLMSDINPNVPKCARMASGTTATFLMAVGTWSLAVADLLAVVGKCFSHGASITRIFFVDVIV